MLFLPNLIPLTGKLAICPWSILSSLISLIIGNVSLFFKFGCQPLLIRTRESEPLILKGVIMLKPAI